MKRTFTTILVALLVSLSLLTSPIAQAAPSSGFYFNPANGNVTPGETFTAALRIANTSAPDINTTFTYNPSLLTITNYSNSGSAYGNPAVSVNNTNGTATISGTGGNGSGDLLITTFTLQTQTNASGTASLTFSGTNQTGTPTIGALGLQIGTTWSNAATTNAQYTIVGGSSSGSTVLPSAPNSSSSSTPVAGSSSAQPGSPSGNASSTPSKSQSSSTPSNKPASNNETDSDAGSLINYIGTPNTPQKKTTQKPRNPWIIIELAGAVIGLIIICIGMLFGYRGYRISHLSAWYEKTTSILLAQSPDATEMPRLLRPIRAIARIVVQPLLLAYHPVKLLAASSQTHKLLTTGARARRLLLPAGRTPLSQRRLHR